MSDYGIELYNNNGYITVGRDFVNNILRSAGQITNSQFNTVSTYYNYVFLDLSAFNYPIIFIKNSTSDQRVAVIPGRNYFQNPGSTTQKSATILKWNNKDVGTLQYYIFDRWIPTTRSTYGLQIFDATPNIVFDSGWDFMRVKNVTWYDPGYPNYDGNTVTGSNWTVAASLGTGNFAVAIPNPRAWIYQGLTTFGVMLYECMHLDSSNNIYTSLVPRGEFLDSAPTQGWAHDNTRSCVMAIDVSGLPTSLNPVSIST